MDITKLKLGKLAPKHDDRTLQLKKYLKAELLPAPPVTYLCTDKITNFGEMLNDTIGDCTCAAAGHMIEVWTANDNNEIVPPDSDILTAYSAISGYNPQTGANDNGCTLIDVLNYWHTTGISKHRIYAFAQIDIADLNYVKLGTSMFLGTYIGLALPISLQAQVQANENWCVVGDGSTGDSASGSWGGHCVPIFGFDRWGLYGVSWGSLIKMSWKFFSIYADEIYAIIPNDFVTIGKAPNGLNISALESDLNDIKTS